MTSNIGRKLFWIFDLLLILAAFSASAWIAPLLHVELSVGGHFHGEWVKMLAPADSAGVFPPLVEYLWIFFIMAPAAVLCIDILGGHIAIRRQSVRRIVLIGIAAPLIATGVLTEVLFLLKSSLYSRLFVLSFAALSGISVCASRLIARAWYNYQLRQGMYAEEVAIIGTAEMAGLVAERFRRSSSPFEYNLVGHFEAGPYSPPTSALPVLGTVADLQAVLIHHAIQRVVMVIPNSGAPWLQPALEACDYFRVTVQILPETLLTSELSDLVARSTGEPGELPALTMAPREWQSDWLFVKRVLDVCVSASLLLALGPLFILIAIGIKVSTPNLPIFYPWRVVGFRGRRFTGYKFTTMYADADAKKTSLSNLNEMSGPVFKIAKDPRVTPFGGFLRKFSLNELPQIWSVLKGDMSLVGPRPAFPHELDRYELWQKRKLSAQPGITCYWQIRGRNRISNFDDWVRLDLEYIQTRSLWVDCKILAMTAWVVIRGTGS